MPLASVLHILAFADLSFLVIRFCSGAFSWVTAASLVGGRRTWPVKSQSVSDHKRDTAPMCGTSVETAAAGTSAFERRALYFSSQQGREQFERSPDSCASLTAVVSRDRRATSAAGLEGQPTPASLCDLEVFKGDRIIATAHSVALPYPSAVWPEIAEFVKNVTEPGCRIRVINEAQETVISIGVATARNTAALAARQTRTAAEILREAGGD